MLLLCKVLENTLFSILLNMFPYNIGCYSCCSAQCIHISICLQVSQSHSQEKQTYGFYTIILFALILHLRHNELFTGILTWHSTDSCFSCLQTSYINVMILQLHKKITRPLENPLLAFSFILAYCSQLE